MKELTNQIVIENVLMGKMRGKVVYQSSFSAFVADQLLYVKPYDLPTGKGYQRPVDIKRCKDFSKYLSLGEDSLFTPILINAESNWEFNHYDRLRPNFGRLICKSKGSLMDGQHRQGGILEYVRETNADIAIPFLAFHYLDQDHEIMLFDTINTKAKGIGTSLNKYLRRDSDEISWIATELIIRKESPFYDIGSVIGKRTNGRHITLQNLYRTLHLLTSDSKFSSFSKEEKLNLAMSYYNGIKERCSEEWNDYKGYRITHIVCLDALSIAGNDVLSKSFTKTSKQIDFDKVLKRINNLTLVDWSVNGPLKYLKGASGSKSLASELTEFIMR
ncbi:DGQHR domain-containing protein [Brevibacillus formosus]|uniref:DGQHR domain-containing protein n=1 Tax=Brevibacillus formosus TaxID=54913 RepID=UPI003F1E0BE2